jgi:DNA-binding transcriptional LysR family regulator
MEMHQVRYFLAVARTRNFTRAADECHVAQPSLTRAIKQLEDELGGDLFRRERPHAQLTELGQRMRPLLQQCYDSAVSAKSLASSVRAGEVGALRLALSRTIDLDLLLPHVIELNDHFRGLELKLPRGTASDVAEFLKRGEAELGMSATLDQGWDRFDCWPLFTEGFQLIVSGEHPLAGKDVVALGDLAGQRLLVRTYCEHAGPIKDLLREADIQVDGAHEVWSERDLMRLIQANMGLAILPSSASVPAALARRPIAGFSLARTIYLFGVAGRERTSIAAATMKLLRAYNWSKYANQGGIVGLNAS